MPIECLLKSLSTMLHNDIEGKLFFDVYRYCFITRPYPRICDNLSHTHTHLVKSPATPGKTLHTGGVDATTQNTSTTTITTK